VPKAPANKAKPVAAKRNAPAPATPPPTPKPVGRLGDQSAPARGPPKASRDPVSIVVARSDIVRGGVRIQAQAPNVVHVARGQVVHVKHAYRLQEDSPDREEYRFLLKSKLAGREPPPALARLGDQWGVPDDITGVLQHEHTLSQPGTFTLEFEAGAEYCVTGWKDTTVKALDRKDLTGRIDVVVS